MSILENNVHNEPMLVDGFGVGYTKRNQRTFKIVVIVFAKLEEPGLEIRRIKSSMESSVPVSSSLAEYLRTPSSPAGTDSNLTDRSIVPGDLVADELFVV